MLLAKDKALSTVSSFNEYAYTNLVYIYLSNLLIQFAFSKFYIPSSILFLRISNCPNFKNASALLYFEHFK